MVDDHDEADRETRDVTIRLPAAWIHDELHPLFPTATSTSEAIRMALNNYVKEEQQLVTAAEIHNDVIRSLQEEGGTIDKSLEIQVEDAESIDIENAEHVTVPEHDSDA